MATFVLVPGAWLGGWCWNRVTPLVRAAGHDVYPVTLTGLGDRAHLAGPDVDLETHILDVVNTLVYEDLRDVILVGHSYAGLVVAAAADRSAERLAHLVYLDALVPYDGMTFFDLWSAEDRAAVEERVRVAGEGWRWPMPDDLGPDAVGLTAEDLRWLRSRAAPQPMKALYQPVRLSNAGATAFRRTYIVCTAPHGGIPDYLAPLRQDPGLRFETLDTGHWPMASAPRQLADLLTRLTDRV